MIYTLIGTIDIYGFFLVYLNVRVQKYVHIKVVKEYPIS